MLTKLYFHRYSLFCLVCILSTFSVFQVSAQDTIPEYQVKFNKAIKLIDSIKYKEALVILKKIIKEKPDYIDAFNKIAFVKIKMLDFKGAAKEIEKAEKLIPLYYETEKLKGINFYLSNNFKESKLAFDTALYIAFEDKIDDPELYYYRALILFKSKKYKPALISCETALDLKENYFKPMVLKGQIRFEMKDYNYAVNELNEAIRNMTKNEIDFEAFKLRAKSKFELQDYYGAIKDWTVYIDTIKGIEENFIIRSVSKININDNSGAISDLDAAIKLNKNNPVSYCYRGVAKGGNKNYLEALKDLDYSIKLKFDYPVAYVNRAAIKMAMKDKQGACTDLRKADNLGSEMAFKLIEKYCKEK